MLKENNNNYVAMTRKYDIEILNSPYEHYIIENDIDDFIHIEWIRITDDEESNEKGKKVKRRIIIGLNELPFIIRALTEIYNNNYISIEESNAKTD